MKIKNMKSIRGFTIVELLMSLVILAMLMATVALAFNASVINYTANKDMYRAMNTARQALLRITSDIRMAVNVDATTAANLCSIDYDGNVGNGAEATYNFDSANKVLNLTLANVTNAGTYVLCEDVSAMTFTKTPATGNAKNVRITMTVTVGDESQTVSTAAVIRRYVAP